MKTTTEHLGYEIRRDRNKRWWVASSPFEGKTFRTLKDAREAIKEVEEILQEFAEEIERNPEGSAIARVELQASYPVRDLGGFDRLDAPETIRRVRRMIRKDMGKAGRGIRLRVDGFADADSGNIGHANAYYDVALVGDYATLRKIVKRVFGYNPADLEIREAKK